VIVAILNVYLVLLFILVKMKIVSFNLFWKCSPLIVLLLLMFGLFIPMGWGAPQGPALVVRNSVAIVPNVAGDVTDVPVEANKPLKAGDVLFKIDPVPYQSQVCRTAEVRRTPPLADDPAAVDRLRPRFRRSTATG
jgi:multidrug resistance efflux pump